MTLGEFKHRLREQFFALLPDQEAALAAVLKMLGTQRRFARKRAPTVQERAPARSDRTVQAAAATATDWTQPD